MGEQEVTPSKNTINVPVFGTPDESYTIQRPGAITIVGSFATETIAKPYENVDLVLQILGAKKQFHRNFSGINLRNIYLWKVAEVLDKIPRFKGRCRFVMVDKWRVALLVKPRKDPKTKLKTRFVIRIHTTMERTKGFFNFLPSCKNIGDEKTSFETPHYNAAVWEELCMTEQTEVVRDAIKICPALRETIILFKVWLYQRNPAQSSVWPSAFHFSVILAHLAHEGVLKSNMNQYHMFRFALAYLTSHDFTKQNIFMRQRIEHNSQQMPGVEQLWPAYRKHFPVAFVDCTGQNLLYKVSDCAYKEFLHCAKITLQNLESPEGFEAAFLRKVVFEENYDFLFRINLIPPKSQDPKTKAMLTEWDWRLHARAHIAQLLRVAIDDRVAGVGDLCDTEHQSWPTKAAKDIPKKMMEPCHILFGIRLKLENAWKTMISGPSADEAAPVSRFKALWGNKVEIRRFKDGRIITAIVFEEPAHLVTRKIIEHLLQLHFGLVPSTINFITNYIDPILHAPGFTDTSRLIRQEYQELCAHLRNANLPLKIIHIMPSDPAFRGTDPAPPRPAQEITDFFYNNRPIDVVLQMQASSQWPRSTMPLQKTKAAFYIRIGGMLIAKSYFVITRETELLVSKDFTYRIIIQHPYEITYMKQEQLPEKEIHSRSLGVFYKPLHHSRITGACGSFPNFGPVCRLAKRWIHAHMLSPHFYEEAIELIVAHLFIHPGPFDPPGSPFSGFLRFLRLVSTFSWFRNPLVIDLDGSLKQSDYDTIHELSRNRRNKAMYIASSYDQGSGWTLGKPSVMVVNRMVDLAGASLQVLRECVQQDRPDYWQAAFATSLQNYPILLKINNWSLLPRKNQQIRFLLGLHKVPTNFIPKRKAYDSEQHISKRIDQIHKYYTGVQCFYDEIGGDMVGIAVNNEPEKISTPLLKTGFSVKDNTTKPNVAQLLEDLAEIFGTNEDPTVADFVKK
eukprot:Phypoly_transcript_01595.p1 GENE.Phypoly_transcript_01595~~Phypoly_transcript_01595.p1  ORF type:complete len:1089 (-),score=143.79 Phypoly_transcript_01595:16-2895(-)